MAHLDRPYGDWPQAVCSIPADAMRLPGLPGQRGRIAVGGPADFIIFRGRRYSELLSRPQFDRVGVDCVGGCWVLEGCWFLDTSWLLDGCCCRCWMAAAGGGSGGGVVVAAFALDMCLGQHESSTSGASGTGGSGRQHTQLLTCTRSPTPPWLHS